jgi:opacity protein-like surface antigen
MLLTMGLAAAAQAADAPSPRSLTVGDRWSLGLALGNFDVDTSDSDDPHLNEVSYALTLGYQPLRYLAIGAELLHVETARQFDEFNELTAFGASGATVSARLQWPLPEDITPYLRVGYTYLQLDEETQIADQPTGNSLGQLSFGAGIQGKYWFAEYINYGRLEGLYLEQMRVGLQFRF